jgi:predicted anti-sigma-YlaC factor YlaD
MVNHHRHTDACRPIARKLAEQLDGTLPRRSAAAIRKHLKHCSNCTAYLDSLKKTILLYRCYPDPRTPTRMRQKLLAILHLPH